MLEAERPETYPKNAGKPPRKFSFLFLLRISLTVRIFPRIDKCCRKTERGEVDDLEPPSNFHKNSGLPSQKTPRGDGTLRASGDRTDFEGGSGDIT